MSKKILLGGLLGFCGLLLLALLFMFGLVVGQSRTDQFIVDCANIFAEENRELRIQKEELKLIINHMRQHQDDQ